MPNGVPVLGRNREQLAELATAQMLDLYSGPAVAIAEECRDATEKALLRWFDEIGFADDGGGVCLEATDCRQTMGLGGQVIALHTMDGAEPFVPGEHLRAPTFDVTAPGMFPYAESQPAVVRHTPPQGKMIVDVLSHTNFNVERVQAGSYTAPPTGVEQSTRLSAIANRHDILSIAEVCTPTRVSVEDDIVQMLDDPIENKGMVMTQYLRRGNS